MIVTAEPRLLECGEGLTDAAIAAAPDSPAVFVIRVREGEPYLARTSLLRRRLSRLLGERDHASRRLNLREVATRIDYWPFASKIESSLLMYDLARSFFPDRYQRYLKLRQPYLIRLVQNDPFPRTAVTTRLSASGSAYFGPFRTRAACEAFESGMLDFYQLRRCQEELAPSPTHPGCVYGEMNRCLRPCQQHVSVDEYASEGQRVAAFLETDGQALVDSISRARDRMSEAMEFEEAARLHKRMEKAAALAQSRDALATGIEHLAGVAVTPSSEAGAVCLWFFWNGRWHPQQTLSLGPAPDGSPQPLDRRVKDAVANIAPSSRSSLRERQDHLALLSAWFYSSWRDGEWVGFRELNNVPYRKIVNAIHRVASRSKG